MRFLFQITVNTCFLFSGIRAFVHPGLLVTETDIARIKTKLSAQLDPWQASWDKLTSIKYSQSNYVHNAVAVVSRDGAAANGDKLWHDTAAAFNLALRWKIEGNATYAEAASSILGSWGKTLTSFAGNDDQYLMAGLQGYQLINAAELLRDYTPFESSGNAQAFIDMFTSTFLHANMFFLNHQAPSEHNHQHFHANWELCNLASAMAFGVYTENATIYDFAIQYFKNGTGNGAINNAITNLVEEPGTGTLMGQPQEAGRDQGHTGLDFQLLGVVAQQAWNQGEDLYGYNNSRILQGCVLSHSSSSQKPSRLTTMISAEYFARYNLGNEVPFEPWTNSIVSFTDVSAKSRGAYRPTWELLYAHYAQIKGVDAPWTALYRNYTVTSFKGFEGGAGSYGEGSGHYDGLGWGSLLHRLDEDDVASASRPPASNNSSSSVVPLVPSSSSVVATFTTSVLPASYVASPTATSVGGASYCT